MSAPDGMTISLTTYLIMSAKLWSSPQGPTTFGPRRNCTAAQTLRSAYIRKARLISTTTITARHCARISTNSPKPVSKKPSIPPPYSAAIGAAARSAASRVRSAITALARITGLAR